MPARIIWPAGAINHLCARRIEGFSYPEIADELLKLFPMRRLSWWTVKTKGKKLALDKHRRKRVNDTIIALRKEGKNNNTIAAEMGMTYNQVNYRIGILLRRGLLDAQSPGRSAPTSEWIRLGS